MSNIQHRIYRFGPYTLDLDRAVLARGQEPLRLASKSIEVLGVLVRNSGTVVTKDDLMRLVWPDQFVSESSITQHIYMLRKTLACADDHQYIVTVSGRGYKFVGEVLETPAPCSDNGVAEYETGARSPETLLSSMTNSECEGIPNSQFVVPPLGGPDSAQSIPSDGVDLSAQRPGAAQAAASEGSGGPRGARRRRKTNLPAQPTRLIGREREVAAIVASLRLKDLRLLTLTGAGGSGKTRLAIRGAGEVLDDFEDGVYFVGLAHVSDPALVIATVAQALGVGEDGKRTIKDCLIDQLEEKNMLLVIDNFEQLMSGELALDELLESCPGLKMMVTSRMVLKLRREHEFHVGPLEVPRPGRNRDIQSTARYSSVALFVERARAVKSDFQLTPGNASTIAEACARLDGLPLAIELAAARLRFLPPEALLARLGDSLGLLSDGARDLPARQQTIRNTIEWSYGLLSEDEKILFRRLAVFVGGFTLEAAESICGTVDGARLEVIGLLSSLIDKNMVYQVSSEAHLEQPRYGMLETIREFGVEGLKGGAEITAVRRQHAEFFCRVAEEAEPMLVGPRLLAALAVIEAELGNLRAAMEWSMAERNPEIGTRIVAATRRFWKSHGLLAEGRSWVDRLLSLPGLREGEELAKALRTAAFFAKSQGETECARGYTREALGISRARGDRRGEAKALRDLAAVCALEQDHNQALVCLQSSLDLISAERDRWEMATVLNDLAVTCFQIGQFDRAKSFYGQSMDLYRELGDEWGLALTQNNYGMLLIRIGDLGQAVQVLRRSLTLAHKLRDRWLTSFCLESIGELHWKMRDLREALCFMAAADSVRSASGLPIPAYSRSAFDQIIDAARSNLSPDDYEQAWQCGWKMSSEEAVAYALEEYH